MSRKGFDGVKIYVNQIPPEGLILKEEISAGTLDLDTEMLQLVAGVKVEAEVYRGINCVSARLSLGAAMKAVCSRCLAEFDTGLDRRLDLNFPVDKTQNIIDLTEDIREGIMLDYPIKPLCKADCLGLCPVCGADLNVNKCGCIAKKE